MREEDLREREQRLLLAEQAAAAGIWEIDLATDTVRGSRQFFLNMGLVPTDDPVPMSVLRALRPAEDRNRVNDGYAKAVESKVDAYESEYPIVRGDGHLRWILGRGKVIRDEAGRPVRYSGIDFDITDRKRAELALVESETRLRLAVVAGNIGIWDWNVLTGEMTYSDEAKAIYGFPPDRPLTFEEVRDATDPRDLPQTLAMAERALDPQLRARDAYEYRIVHPTGEVRWLYARGEATFAEVDGAERAVRYTGTILDITERKKSERRLQKSEQRLRLAIEAGQMAIWEFAVSTQELIAAPDLNRILGFAPETRLTIDQIRELYLPGEREKVQVAAQLALERGETRFESEFRCRRRDGIVRWLMLRAEILFAEDGSAERVIGVLVDIDDRKRAEERQALLLRELNHRVKNSLSVVRAIANQSFRGKAHPEALSDYTARLVALAAANDTMLERGLQDFDLKDLVFRIIEPYAEDTGRCTVLGESLVLPPRLNVPLGLTLHELATNAAKYGALSGAVGTVVIDWRPSDTGTRLIWREAGGPATDGKPRKGFGLTLVEDLLSVEIGSVDIAFQAGGLVATIDIRHDGAAKAQPPPAEGR